MGTIDGHDNPRILFRAPLVIHACGTSARAHTAVVNRRGALLLSPLRLAEETLIKAVNADNESVLLFRVVFYGGEELPGLHKLGVESLTDASGFWGPEFESRLGEAHAASEKARRS